MMTNGEAAAFEAGKPALTAVLICAEMAEAAANDARMPEVGSAALKGFSEALRGQAVAIATQVGMKVPA